jgi:8-oxo-dGTP pyrophosphatase MutT (NUDIX family)
VDRHEIRRRLEGSCSTGYCPPESSAARSPCDYSPLVPAAPPAEPVPAAVLVGIVARPDGPCVILTERTAHLNHHAAEISFPGGRMEPGDSGPAEAALREAFEEIGLPPSRVEILGCLSPYHTVTDFCIYPIVGWIEPPVEFELDTNEVAHVFEVSLGLVLDTSNYDCGSLEYKGKTRTFFVLLHEGHRIWGATAAILVNLAGALSNP